MKKLAILLLAMFVVAGTVMAQEGLYIGAEFYAEDVSEFGDTVGSLAYVGYEFEIIENLDLFAEATVDIPFGDLAGLMGKIALWAEVGVKYHFTENFYAGGSTSILLFSGLSGIDPFDFVLLRAFGGYETDTFGAELAFYGIINDPFNTDFAQMIELYGYYRFGSFIPGLTIGIPIYKNGFDEAGLTITPEFTWDFNDNFDFYVELPIGGIGSDDGVGIGITLGAKFSF